MGHAPRRVQLFPAPDEQRTGARARLFDTPRRHPYNGFTLRTEVCSQVLHLFEVAVRLRGRRLLAWLAIGLGILAAPAQESSRKDGLFLTVRNPIKSPETVEL